jgi:methanogenic corrinoid protein MtbC1
MRRFVGTETKASDLLREAHALYELPTVFMQVIVPVLREIGEAWYRGEIRVTTEHFASAFLRGKLLSLLQAYPTRRTAPFLLVGCAPMEQHELGSLMLAVMLRSQGYRVEYLGPDIPVEDLADYASYELPAMVILAATSEDTARMELRRLQALLKDIDPQPIFGYGGRAFDLHPELRQQIAGHLPGRHARSRPCPPCAVAQNPRARAKSANETQDKTPPAWPGGGLCYTSATNIVQLFARRAPVAYDWQLLWNRTRCATRTYRCITSRQSHAWWACFLLRCAPGSGGMDLPNPGRGEQGYRLYSEHDVRVLRWLKPR